MYSRYLRRMVRCALTTKPPMLSARVILWIVLLFVGVPAARPQSSDVLPAPLYFIRYSDQVWRMERDGETLSLIADEAARIIEADISPRDGALVYVSDNDLIRTDAFGAERVILVDGVDIPSSADVAPDYLLQLREQIASPVWSPDGSRIAFARGGVNMISAQGGEPERLLANSVPENEAPEIAFLGSVSYRPMTWSPDGARLLVEVTMPPESGGLAILNLTDHTLIPITNQDYGSLTCCYPSWSADGDHLYYSIANHFFTAGLWRADAQTGESEKLIEGLDNEGTYTLVAYPRQLSDGLLYSFTTITDNPDPNDILPLEMYRSNADGTELEALRGDNYFLSEVLWAADGSGAVIKAIIPSATLPDVLWMPATSGTSAVQLGISGYNLRWGVE